MAGVLDALASYVQNMLTQMAVEKVHMLLGVSGEIDNMGIKLRDLKNFLADADRRNITDRSVQLWVTELRNAMYDATDILDMCHLKAKEQGRRHDAGCFNPLLFCIRNPLHAHDIGNRIKKLNMKLDDIKARATSFNFINLGAYEDHGRNKVSYGSGTRETSGGLDESCLVGEMIEEYTTNLVDMLTKKYPTNANESNKIMVFSIVGVGGIGKTTLAQKIFNNEVIKQEFGKKIWLSVNQCFDHSEMLRRVIIETGGTHHDCGNSKVALERSLIEALKGQKTLLIMDDVWDSRIWEGVLKNPFSSAMLAEGSRVLVTTRHDIVAREMKAEEPYHRIDRLGHDDAWLLFKKQVVRDVNDEQLVEILKDIGMRLVQKCDGLPLGVKVMGGLMRHKRLRRTDWQKVFDDSLWSVSALPEELNYAIYLSYEDLHPCLKPCFLHCSLIPKGARFSAYDIIGMWISEGFVHGTSCDLEEMGWEYYDELIQRNLIELDKKYVDLAVFDIHDVVRSFAQNMLGEEALIAHNSKLGIEKLKSQSFIRLSLENNGSEQHDLEWCSLQTQISLRTMILVGNIKIKTGDSFHCFTSLRTLHLYNINFDALAESIHQLKHLRYLLIDNCHVSRLPENIGKMKFLEYINVRCCHQRLVKFPRSIGKLQYLRFLGLDMTNTSVVPRDFCGLTSLRKLYGFPAHMDYDHCSLEELGPLSQLTHLDIRYLENVDSSSSAMKAVLDEKNHLRELSLNCTSRLGDDGLLEKQDEGISHKEKRQIEEVFDVLCPPLGLESLDISGYFGQRLPGWMMPGSSVAALWSLRMVMMDDLACCTELPSGLSQFPCLEFLQIRRAPAIKRVGLEFLQPSNQLGVAFPRLQELHFEAMVEWEEWQWEEQVKGMPVLEEFTFRMCKLRRVPPGLAFHAKALKKLCIYYVKHLSYLENFASVVHLDVFTNTDLERISNFPKLQKLVIVKCPKMKVLEGMPALQRLNLEDYVIETVPRCLQDVKPRHLELDCSLSLLTCIAAGESGAEWHKFSHIQQVKCYAYDEGCLRKWYMLYRRDPFYFDTNISRSAIRQAHSRRTWLAYGETCPIEDEWPTGRHAQAEKRVPLCVRFRCNAYRHLVPWLRQTCLHCREANGIASPSDQWTQAAVYRAGRRIVLTGRKNTSGA